MHHVTAALPPAGARTGRGQSTVADGDDAGWSVAGSGRITRDVLDPDRPSAVRHVTGDGNIPAEADQDAAAESTGDPLGRPVGRPGLCRRPEVESHAGRHSEQTGLLVELDLAPPWDVAHRDPEFPTLCGHRGEVAVVADRLHRPSNGGVDVAVGELC